MATFNSKLDTLREKALYYSDTRGDHAARQKLHAELFSLVYDVHQHAIRAKSDYAIQETKILCDDIGEAKDEIDTAQAIDLRDRLWGTIPDERE
jgi:hypothetical protein